MDDRNNTIAGWVLAACGAALGLSIVGGMVFHSGEPEKSGYPIEAAEEAGGGGAAEVPIASLLPTADPAKGADVFKKCAACHTINQGGANGIGPNLYGVMGEAVAHGRNGYAFSDALKKVGGNWDWEKMNAWLTSPRKFAPGTKMTFAGLSNPQDRANIILYMNQQGSNLPLPAAPATGAAPETDGGNTVQGGGGGGAAPGAANAVDAVEKDIRGQTGDLANTATPESGAPSIDPAAQKQNSK